MRNRKVNSQLAALVDRVGVTDAPSVAEFYLLHNGALYVRAKHCTDLLLRDAEGLHTEWARGQQVTAAEATALDRKQANYNAFAPLIAEAEAREASTGTKSKPSRRSTFEPDYQTIDHRKGVNPDGTF